MSDSENSKHLNITQPNSGLSQLDRIALRVVGAITTAGIIASISILSDLRTDIAVMQNEVKYVREVFSSDLDDVKSRISVLEKYTDAYKESEKERQVDRYRLERLENNKK